MCSLVSCDIPHPISALLSGAAQVSNSQFDDLKRQLNEARGTLEDTRTKLARAQDEITAKDMEVG